MAILGKDPMGMFNPGLIKLKEEVQEELPVEPITTENQQFNEEPIQSNPGASLEFLDRMRGLKNGARNPIGNQLQSDAKAQLGNNRFGA